MTLKNNTNECNMLLDLNTFIHHENKMYEYHMHHIKLVRKYALLLNKKLNANISPSKLTYIAFSHDLFKERSLDPKQENVTWKGFNIPQDLNRYVRSNLDILEEYGLDDYFNSDCQLHALSAGIFLRSEFGIKDKEILYPVMFHSCPVISVYETLPLKIRKTVDIIMLADKLSSNYLRINYRESPVRVDLDKVVFGSNGLEFNYTLGLFIARILSQGKSEEEQSTIATEYYYNRLCEVNPIIQSLKDCNFKKLGGSKVWPKRKSQVWRKH